MARNTLGKLEVARANEERFREILASMSVRVGMLNSKRRGQRELQLSTPGKHRIQITGERTVDWRPISSKRVARIAGDPYPRLSVMADEVIAWALGKDVRAAEKQMQLFTEEQEYG